MDGKKQNSEFAAMLERDFRAQIDAEESSKVETQLGEGAISYKLNSAGVRVLFKALSNQR